MLMLMQITPQIPVNTENYRLSFFKKNWSNSCAHHNNAADTDSCDDYSPCSEHISKQIRADWICCLT